MAESSQIKALNTSSNREDDECLLRAGTQLERDEKQVAEVVDSNEMSKLSYNMLWKPRAICSTYTREYAWLKPSAKTKLTSLQNPFSDESSSSAY